jgi:hypothetical protein
MERLATLTATTTATTASEDRAATRPGVAELAADLRAAIIAGDSSRAQQIASSYAEALRTLWDSLPAEQRTVSGLPEEARNLLLWAQQATMIQRNLAADHLDILHRMSGYRQSTTSPRLQIKA